MRLRVNAGDGYVDIDTVINDGDEITVRGRRCTALKSIWRSQFGTGRGGAAVLARFRGGKDA